MTTRPLGRGMAAFCAVIAVLQIRPATGAPGDIFRIPAPAINADPPKATDIKDGDASVSTQTGALQYSYPIQVPPGRNGMVPQLALSYSSQAPTYGGVAAGWTLSIPLISEDHSQGRLRTRSSQVEAEQLLEGRDPKQDDRFVSSLAGGRPLVLVTEPTGVAGDVYAAYRAQNDTSFTRYERMAAWAPYRWRARTTDGKVLTFGEAARMPSCTATDQYAPLTGMVDQFGNEVRYEYNSTIAGECKIVRITWGQNGPANLPDFAQVIFKYKIGVQCNGVYSNSQTDYRSVTDATPLPIVTGVSRLETITATAYAPGAPSSPVHTRTILLDYDGNSETCSRPHAPVRLLTSIREIAWGVDSPTVTLPPVTFEYNSAAVRLLTPQSPPREFAPWALDRDSNNLGWGFRYYDDRWPTVESMFLDVDGDGLQDLVTNANTHVAPTECSATWYRNTGPNENGELEFDFTARSIALPRLKWNGTTSPPVGGAAQADRATPANYENCALNGQVTAYKNAYKLANACHHAPGSFCRAASDPLDENRYCDPGGTRCPADPGLPEVVDGAFRTYLAYRWLDMDSDGLVDLVAAVHGDIDSYDIERGNRPGYTAGEPSMSGIPGLNQWPACPQSTNRCKHLDDCLEKRGARQCDREGCRTNWNDVLACISTSLTTGCAHALMKANTGPQGAPPPSVQVFRHPYERCEGLYPWFIYKNEGNGVFASAPVVKYQPVPLESSSGDSSFGSGVSITSESHAILDFDGDGWLDAVVRETKLDEDGNWTGNDSWQVWQGDGTGGFGPQMHVFPTRPYAPCPVTIANTCAFGGNAISGVAGTYSQSVLSLGGLLDINGDGAQDHWIALLEKGNANVAFNRGDELELVGGTPPIGKLTTPINLPSYAVKPGNDTFVELTNPPPLPEPEEFIKQGFTITDNRVVDVDHDGRVDVVNFAAKDAWPMVHFNVGGQFIAPGVAYGSGVAGVSIEGLKRQAEAVEHTSTFDTLRWRLNSDLIDLDGDGIQEGAYFFDLPVDGEFVRRFLRARPQSSQPPRLLRAIHNGRGAHSTIEYAQMHDEKVVIQNPGERWPDGRPKASPRAQWVVKSIQVQDDYAGTNATTQYEYKNPRHGADDEGHYSFRGFEEVTTTKPDSTGAPNGARTVQRYGYDVDWSGRLVETIVMPSKVEGANDARTIDVTEWQELTLFGGAIKTYHAAIARHLVCKNGQTELTCKDNPVGYSQTTMTYTAYPDTPTSGDEQLWVESGSLLQESQSASDGDRQTSTIHELNSHQTFYMVYPVETVKRHRVGGTMVMFAKSQQTWDRNNGTQLTDEVWTSSLAADRAITRYEYDPATGNRTKVWKPVQWAPNQNPITNLIRTRFKYDSRQLFVATEINERGFQVDYEYEYGTGTKLKTIGPNAGSCVSNPSTCPAGTTAMEERWIRVDGLGRMLERWEPVSPQTGGVVSYVPVKVETNTYVDTPSATTPTSVTHTAFVDTNAGDSHDMTELDGHGRPIKKTIFVFGSAPANQVTTFHYGHDGTLREVRVPDPSVNNASTVTYRYEFDSLGRPISMRRPDSSVLFEQSGVRISYDGLTTTTEELVGAAGGQPAVTRTTNDSFGRLVRVEEKLDSTEWAATTYKYDPDDNVEKIVGPAPDLVTTLLKHDFAGRRTEITRGGRTWKYGYDANGNLKTITSPTPCAPALYCDLDYTTSIAYDELDRPTSKLPAPRDLSDDDIALFGLHEERFVWDYGVVGHHGNYKGQLIYWRAHASPSKIAVQLNRNYNAQGNLTSGHLWFNTADYNVSRERLSSYAPSGLVTYTHYRDFVGASTGYTTSIQRYDRRGLPSSMTVTRVNSGGQRTLALQTRNVAGLVTKRLNNVGGAMTFVESNWAYDRLGRVLSQEVQKGPGPELVAKQELRYFGNDDPRSLDHFLGSSNRKCFEFSYDPRHQLRTVRETLLPNAFRADYEYGEAGRFRRASVAAATALPHSDVAPRDVTYEYEGADPEQVTALVQTSNQSTVHTSYAYDLAGNQTIRCKGVLSGATCSGESMHYLYDGKDQLRRATKKDSQGNTLAIEEYWYDDANVRVATVKRDGNGTKTGLIVWTGPIEAHYNGQGAAIRVYSYLGMGTPVARIDRTGPTSAPLEYQFHGLASNTLATVAENGTINASFVYAPFGEIIEATDDGGWSDAGVDAHRRRMNDKFVDEVSGLAYYGFRYYDKTSMTWTQSDPLYRFAPDLAKLGTSRRANLYSFSLQNPLRYVDPDGRDSTTCKEQTPEGGSKECTTGTTGSEQAVETADQSAATPGPEDAPKYGQEHGIQVGDAAMLVAVWPVTAGLLLADWVYDTATGDASGTSDEMACAGCACGGAAKCATKSGCSRRGGGCSGKADETGKAGKETAERTTALPDSYWIEKRAPTQVTPGTRTVNEMNKPSSAGGTYHSTTHYDQHGRQIGQTHRTTHGRADHANPHHHRRDPATGEQLKDPRSGSRVWPGLFGN